MHHPKAVTTSAAILLLAGCTVGPDYHPETPVAVTDDWSTASAPGEVDLTWWRAFQDPLLTELVESAALRNLDLKEATARLAEARANRDAVRGRRSPEVNAQGSLTENRLSENGQLPIGQIPGAEPRFELFDVGFDASWELDLWGRTRRSIEGADARLAAASESRNGVVLQIIAEVVRSYLDLRDAQAQAVAAAADVQANQGITDLVGQRFRAGEGNRLDLSRASERLQASRAALPKLVAEERAASYRLALLTGRMPEELAERLLEDQPLPQLPISVSAGLRSDLLRRRPDIRQAERELAAATADIGVATADLFPRISLIGSLGQQARSPEDLFSTDSTRFQIGPSFSWPIFSAGRIRAQIRATDARAEAAAVRYERSILTALADSETALNRYARALDAHREQMRAVEESRTTLRLARQRYSAGEDRLTAALDAQSDFAAAERREIEARKEVLVQLVSLYKSLGGGWEYASTDPAAGGKTN